jgi:hypothetical protein
MSDTGPDDLRRRIEHGVAVDRLLIAKDANIQPQSAVLGSAAAS